MPSSLGITYAIAGTGTDTTGKTWFLRGRLNVVGADTFGIASYSYSDRQALIGIGLATVE